ncbi:MAG: VCBS domain-containing protein, partial [Luminiphilus sp.]|nr:VCBS domain-containing protein [Luminiphilus sp.]
LAELTAADIAASDDITGAGGDWELEGNTGPIEANTIQARDYQYFLANGIASVNSNTVDKTPSSGSLNVKASPDGGISDSQDRWMVMLEKSNITEADTLYFYENVSVSSYNVSSSTPVASYLVALNDDANRRTQSTGGQVTFEHDILGIYTHKNNTLKSGTLQSTGNNNVTTLSNSYFSNSSWTYPTAGPQSNQRDFEGSFGSYGNGNWVWSADGNDHAAWSSNSRTLYLAAKNGNSTGTGDFVRVITKWEVPGPTAQDDFAFVNEGGTVAASYGANASGVTGGFTDANRSLNVSFSGNSTTDVEGVHFNNDGTKLYLNDQENGDYQQYSLSTPFDVSSATWDSRTFNGPSGSRGLAFNSDGTKAFTVSYSTDLIYEYSLSSAFNIDTASELRTRATADAPGTTDSVPEDLAFNSDGTKLYYLEQSGERIYQLNLSTAYNISTATDGGYLDVSAEQDGNNWNSGLAISSDGRKLFAIDNQKTVFEWFLQTADDITSAALVGSRTYLSFGDLTGISFSNDGTKAFMADATVSNDEDAVEFNASIPFSNMFAAGGNSGDLLHTSVAASQDSGSNLFVNGFRLGGIEGQGTFSHSNGGSLEGEYGTLTMQTTGAYSYTANSDIANLDAGEVVYDQFNYKAQDGDGNNDHAVLTITIVGQDDPNQPPTVSTAAVDPSVSEAVDASNQVLLGSGTIEFADDTDSSLTITAQTSSTVSASSGVTLSNTLQNALAASITLSDNGDNTANWTLNTDGLDLDFLAVGDSITIENVVTATDDDGETVTDTITVTINGTNDAPTTTDNYQVRVNERNIINGAVFTPANTTKIFSTDDFPFTDAEDAEFTNIRISSPMSSTDRGNLEYSNDSGSSFTAVTQGGLVVSHADIASGYLRYVPSGSGYNNFRFEAQDSSGAYSAEATIQITTNAAPRESGIYGVPNIAPGESIPASGTLTLFPSWPGNASDLDDYYLNMRVSGTAPGSNNALITDGTGVGTNVAGTYGTFTIDASGTYVYTANTSNSLPAGSTGIDDFEIFVRDDEGDDPNGAGSHAYGVFTRSFEVDASAQTTSTPVAADDTIDATSGTPETGSVLDNDSDPDGTTPSISAIETGSTVGGGTAGSVGSALPGTYGSLTLNQNGNYTYTVDADNADVLALGANDNPLTETFIYTITDGTETDTAIITVNVSGVNDAPTVTQITDAQSEDYEQYDIDLLTAANAADIDDGDSGVMSGDTTLTYEDKDGNTVALPNGA